MNYVAIAIILVILILWISSRRGGPIRHLRKTIKRAIKRKNKITREKQFTSACG